MTQRTVKLESVVKQCAGLVDTGDLSHWENDFVADMNRRMNEGTQTTLLSGRQIDVLLRIWDKHFA